MDVLIIESHSSKITERTMNVHARNSYYLAEALGADLMPHGEYEKPKYQKQYDAVVFVHTSNYLPVKDLWRFLREKEGARIFYVANEYTLNEPMMLWPYSEEKGRLDRRMEGGIKCSVIANHSQEASKILEDYIEGWHIVNLNCLIYNREFPTRKGLLF